MNLGYSMSRSTPNEGKFEVMKYEWPIAFIDKAKKLALTF